MPLTNTYDPENWLVSLTRSLEEYVRTTLNDPDTDVEMDFPNTREWPKTNPLEKALIHFEQDTTSNPTYGFGVPGDDVYDNPNAPTTILHREAALHLVNFDVGVWVSAQSGGVTKRMALVQALIDMFQTATGKTALYQATDGITVVSFEGGRNELDRINDVPVWRALDMTLVVRVVSRHVPAQPDLVTATIDQNQELTIRVDDGTDKPVVTP